LMYFSLNPIHSLQDTGTDQILLSLHECIPSEILGLTSI
jgi:hypothetical protein